MNTVEAWDSGRSWSILDLESKVEKIRIKSSQYIMAPRMMIYTLKREKIFYSNKGLAGQNKDQVGPKIHFINQKTLFSLSPRGE